MNVKGWFTMSLGTTVCAECRSEQPGIGLGTGEYGDSTICLRAHGSLSAVSMQLTYLLVQMHVVHTGIVHARARTR
jgi:hypothetical protein